MEIETREEPIDRLSEHGTVPISFLVTSVLDVLPSGPDVDEARLTERLVDRPWEKDYDAIEANAPSEWPARFDVTSWGLIGAYDGDERMGGAVVLFDSPDVHMLEGRSDLAVIWDLRVRPGHRSVGVGTALFRAAERWARERGCVELKIETQNINVAACRFYQRMGCRLVGIDPSAYPGLPDEVQLLWSTSL